MAKYGQVTLSQKDLDELVKTAKSSKDGSVSIVFKKEISRAKVLGGFDLEAHDYHCRYGCQEEQVIKELLK